MLFLGMALLASSHPGPLHLSRGAPEGPFHFPARGFLDFHGPLLHFARGALKGNTIAMQFPMGAISMGVLAFFKRNPLQGLYTGPLIYIFQELPLLGFRKVPLQCAVGAPEACKHPFTFATGHPSEFHGSPGVFQGLPP